MELLITKPYMLLPVSPFAEAVQLTISGNRAEPLTLTLRLDPNDNTATLVAYDVSRYIGQTVIIELPIVFEVCLSDTPSERVDDDRPALHLTAPYGWLNDPNGLFTDTLGRTHIYYQHNPVGIEWGNMHWGHMMTSDFKTFVDCGDVLFPDQQGAMFSGSAYRHQNGSVTAYYTAWGDVATQRIAYSDDHGMSFRKEYGEPPFLPVRYRDSRDPKIERDPAGGYLASLFLTEPDLYAVYASPDLVRWERVMELRMEHDRECPGFFPLPYGDRYLYAMMGANGWYRLYERAGAVFAPVSTECRLVYGDAYAGQNWFVDDGRCLRIDWLRYSGISKRGFSHYGALSFPYELKLQEINGVPTLTASPSAELSARETEKSEICLFGGGKLIASSCAYRLDLRLSEALAVQIDRACIVYDVDSETLALGDNSLSLPLGSSVTVLVDRDGVELFAGGCLLVSMGYAPILSRGARNLGKKPIRLTLTELSPVIYSRLEEAAF